MSSPETTVAAARVVLSYAPGEDVIGEGLAEDSYRTYLRRAHGGPVAVGEEWDEFVNCGCGSTRDVTLRVESLAGGETIGNETEIAYEPRADDAG